MRIPMGGSSTALAVSVCLYKEEEEKIADNFINILRWRHYVDSTWINFESNMTCHWHISF